MNEGSVEPFVEEIPDIIRLTSHDNDDVQSDVNDERLICISPLFPSSLLRSRAN